MTWSTVSSDRLNEHQKILTRLLDLLSFPVSLFYCGNIFMEPFQHIPRRIIPRYEVRKVTIQTLTRSHSDLSSISPNNLGEMTRIYTKPRSIIIIGFYFRIPHLYGVRYIEVVWHTADVLAVTLPLFFACVTQFSVTWQFLGPSLSIPRKRRGPPQRRYIMTHAQFVVGLQYSSYEGICKLKINKYKCFTQTTSCNFLDKK